MNMKENILKDTKRFYKKDNLLLMARRACSNQKLLFVMSKWEFNTPIKLGMYENLGFNKDFKCRSGFNVIPRGKHKKSKRKRRRYFNVINYKVTCPFKLSSKQHVIDITNTTLLGARFCYKEYSRRHKSMYSILKDKE